MATPHELASAALSEEMAAVETRKNQIMLVENVISRLTEEELEALMNLSSVCHKAGMLRMRELQARAAANAANIPAGPPSIFEVPKDKPNG